MGQSEGNSSAAFIIGSSWVGTCNRGSFSYASEELRRQFESIRVRKISDGDVFRFDVGADEKQVLDSIVRRPPVFLRHLQPIHLEVALQGDDSDLPRIREAVRGADWELNVLRVAVQARKAEGSQPPYTPLQVKQAIDEALVSVFAAEPTVHQMEKIISVFLTPAQALIGCSGPDDNLSSWSGGAVHFRKEDGDISRAKFKLMEAELAFGLDFSAFRNALDIGAAPGGWSSFLLERGLSVTAIDPAAMHPSLMKHPKFIYLNKNASEVLLRDKSFDLIVCDMSWEPRRMAQLVSELLEALAPGGTVVSTVKLMHGKPFATLRHVQAVFEPKLKLARAKQLFHNREELTCVWRKN
ncbi:SAM-dependent methyltransferase [Paenibacillus alkalitolerans]|uniref:SAM-dependent methyltransferase n=1 Tax=Paenibacillus alkalitolerans TaxID=2799335 RepID=UPI002D7FB681|nr:SAM-dependent methyltransferase [Paenibacillus alkalitolerans]